MTTTHSWLALGALALGTLTFAGCTTGAGATTPLGTAVIEVSDVPVHVTAAWAEPGYTQVDDGSYGAFIIEFAVGAHDGELDCGTTTQATLANSPQTLDIQTTDHFSSFTPGSPSIDLATGDIPLVDEANTWGDPTSVTASFEGLYPDISSGLVTITAVDDVHMAGTFTGSGADLAEADHIHGSFDIPICASE